MSWTRLALSVWLKKREGPLGAVARGLGRGLKRTLSEIWPQVENWD